MLGATQLVPWTLRLDSGIFSFCSSWVSPLSNLTPQLSGLPRCTSDIQQNSSPLTPDRDLVQNGEWGHPSRRTEQRDCQLGRHSKGGTKAGQKNIWKVPFCPSQGLSWARAIVLSSLPVSPAVLQGLLGVGPSWTTVDLLLSPSSTLEQES